MQSENGATDPLLAVLPPLIHFKKGGEDAAQGLRTTVSHIFEELGSGRSGAAAVVTRLADILFMQAVRAYLDENIDTAESGWLAALRDQQIGRALVLLHDKPHLPWTVAEIADRVALSRSAFAAKFTELVGEPPLRYLTRLRLNAATARLRSGNDKLSVIAAAAGYESVPAFAKAFKRHMGVTPGEYRRSRQKGCSV
jgi:AraC-like DNA-binding protein